jgi:hypothetical protein
MNATRELKREERAAVQKLVTKECANYQREYGCLPLDGDCYMLGKWWTGGFCKHFLAAVLPLDPALDVALTDGGANMRLCAFCGNPYRVSGKRLYCSDACAGKAQRKQKREYIRKRRGRV